MEYLVTMTTEVPQGTADTTVKEVRAREAVRSGELAAEGHLLRLWRPPLHPGEWRTIGLFAAEDNDQLEDVLASMPLHVGGLTRSYLSHLIQMIRRSRRQGSEGDPWETMNKRWPSSPEGLEALELDWLKLTGERVGGWLPMR